MITVLISKLSSMILLTLAGLLFVRLKILKTDDSHAFSRLIISVLQPCLIIRAFQVDLTRDRIFGFVSSLIFGFIVYIIWIFLSMFLKRVFSLNKVEEMTLIYGNIGNLILPLVQMVLGDEMVFYASALQVPFNLFLWTHCNAVLSGKKKAEFKNILLNSNVIAVYIGLFLMVMRIRLPEIIDTTMGSLAAMVGPLSMIVIGVVIGQKNLRQVFTFKKGYLVAFLRLLAYPLIIISVLYFIGILKIYPELTPVFQVIFFALAAPPAAMVSQLAVIYNEDPEEAGILNVIGTCLCTITMPAVIAVYQFLFPI